MKTISVALEPSFETRPNKGGRPRKELDQHTFEALCEIQCTLAEIAGVLRVSEDTVERWRDRTYELGFAECFKKFSAGGKTSLRRQQFELAMKGNPAMLIWLGKQYLDNEIHYRQYRTRQLPRCHYRNSHKYFVQPWIQQEPAIRSSKSTFERSGLP